MSPALDRCAHRVAQEGLTNALAALQPRPGDVTIHHVGDDLVVTVHSEGRCTRRRTVHRSRPRRHEGARAVLGGVFQAGPFGEQGFAVRAALPLSAGRVAEGAWTPRVVVADDEELVREGLVTIVRSRPYFEVVEPSLMATPPSPQATDLRPDVAPMDVAMPGTDGIEATRRIVGAVPDARVLVLTMVEADDVLFAALRAGPAASSSSRYRATSRGRDTGRSRRGTRCSRSALTRRLIEAHLAGGARRNRVCCTRPTARPTRSAGRGASSNAEAAGAPSLHGPRQLTVKGYVSELLARHGLRDRAQLVQLARRPVGAGVARRVLICRLAVGLPDLHLGVTGDQVVGHGVHHPAHGTEVVGRREVDQVLPGTVTCAGAVDSRSRMASAAMVLDAAAVVRRLSRFTRRAASSRFTVR